MITATSPDLYKYIQLLERSQQRIVYSAHKFVKKLTDYAHDRMKQYATGFNAARSTGSLNASIDKKMKASNSFIEGKAFVPNSIKAFVQEWGIKKQGQMIWGNPSMSFPASHWKRGATNSKVASIAQNGKYRFVYVRRGKYQGKHFTEKAFMKTVNLCEQSKDKVASEIINSLKIRLG